MRHSDTNLIVLVITLSVVLLAGLFILPIRESSHVIFSSLEKYNIWSGEAPSGHLAVGNNLATPEPLRLLFFGDLMLDRHVGEVLAKHNLAYLLAGVLSKATSSLATSSELESKTINARTFDLVGANLEGAVTDGGQHYSPTNSYDFAFSPSRINELSAYGFNYFNLANNHFSDQGRAGVAETRTNLNQLGFTYSGEVDAQISSSSVTIIERQQKKLALIGLSMVYNDFDLEAAKKLVTLAQTDNDLVIINIHWGQEYQHQFNSHQQTIGRALIDSGADVIIGHHPHVVQGVEIYKNKPIFYSLGNFIFDQYFSVDTQTGLAVGLELSATSTTISLFPLQSQTSAVFLKSGADKDKFLKQLIFWSQLNEDQATSLGRGRLVLDKIP
jgi:poly-gamma-glutamate synthesis protein (capsule biosynthesis protein)